MKDSIRRFIIRMLFTNNERYIIWAGVTHYTTQVMKYSHKEGCEANVLRELFMKLELRPGINPTDALKAFSELKSDIENALLTSPENIHKN